MPKTNVCGARTRAGSTCNGKPMENGRCRLHGGKATGAPKGNQNAVGHGPPVGNSNARTHGLYSPILGALGREFYEAAKGMADDDLARDTAHFAIGKIAEAYGQDPEYKGAVALLDAHLAQLVESETISPGTRDRIIKKLADPDIGALGKALAPVKNLLDVKHRHEMDRHRADLDLKRFELETQRLAAGTADDDDDFNGSLFASDQVYRMAQEVVAKYELDDEEEKDEGEE